jgi:hypothetical protein
MGEALGSSEASILAGATGRSIPEDAILHIERVHLASRFSASGQKALGANIGTDIGYTPAFHLLR